MFTLQDCPSISKLSLHLSLVLAVLASTPVAAAEADNTAGPSDDQAKTLDTVQVFGTLDDQLGVGSKTGQSLRETPKSITVMNNERIEAQNLTSLTEALIQTTGVTVGAYSPVDSFYYSRGFRVQTLQFDGGAPAYTGDFGFFYTPDTAAYDHIEMLRGVDGMYTGAGEPGGVINMVRKRPEAENAVRLDISAGSWDSYRAQLDVTGPLAFGGRLRGRAVAAYVDRGYFWERAKTEKKIVYGVLEFDATDTTLVSFGANYEKRDESNYMGYGGVPRYTDGRDLGLPRETAFNPDWARWDFVNKELFAKVDQQYGETGVLRLNLTNILQDSVSKHMIAYGAINPNTLAGSEARASYNEYSSSQSLADLSASGKFSLFGRESHSYTVGADYAMLDGGGQKTYQMIGYSAAPRTPVNVFDFNPALYPDRGANLLHYYRVNEQSQRGLYATVGLQLADPLRLTLGGRYGKYETHTLRDMVTNNTTYVLRYSDSAFIPSAALSFDISDKWTSYLSYGENFKPQANMLKAPLPGTPLDPVTGDSLELGVKGELFGHLNAAAAIYRVERVNQGVLDPLYPNTPGEDGSSCCFMEQADVKAEGLDLELSGVVLPGWQLFAGYTFVKTTYEEDPDRVNTTGAYWMGVTPRHQFKLWSTWRLPGKLSGWTVNGGVIAQSSSFMKGTALADANNPSLGTVPFQFTQAGYALWNASLQYEVNDTWTVGLYGDNLTDVTYYQAIGSTIRQNVYGTPRSYTLTLKGRW